MGLLDDIRLRGVASRITEEALYAEALREVEAGQRRDGLWAKALSDSKMNTSDAQALYLKLRVRALRDEIEVLHRSIEQSKRNRTEDEDLTAANEFSVHRHSLQSKANKRQSSIDGGSPLGNMLAKWLGILLLAILAISLLALVFD